MFEDKEQKAGHIAMKRECARDCAEIVKLKRHITAFYVMFTITMIVFSIVVFIGAFKLEVVITEHMAMKAQIIAHDKRLDVQREDIGNIQNFLYMQLKQLKKNG